MIPIKVLYSLGSLRRGGIETWLTNIVKLRRPELRIDFLLDANPGESGDYEKLVQSEGCRLFYRPTRSFVAKRAAMIGLWPADPSVYHFLRLGRYDVFHVHANEFNGDAMLLAKRAGVPVRIAHCHHTQLARGKKGFEMVIRRLRHETLDRVRLLNNATDICACGRDAGYLLAGNRWATDSRCKVIYCGVPLDDFSKAWALSDRVSLLNRYSLPADAIVIGHAGSMGPVPVKNHEFLIRAFRELSLRDSRYHLVMAGDGPLRRYLESIVKELNLSTRVRFTGLISDVPAHMAHLFDVHVLPSLAEGLPIVAIEAAAAGLYTVMSENITNEVVEHLPGRAEQLSLEAPLATWADRIEHAIGLRELPSIGIARVRATPLSIDRSAQDLSDMYRARLASTR